MASICCPQLRPSPSTSLIRSRKITLLVLFPSARGEEAVVAAIMCLDGTSPIASKSVYEMVEGSTRYTR